MAASYNSFVKTVFLQRLTIQSIGFKDQLVPF